MINRLSGKLARATKKGFLSLKERARRYRATEWLVSLLFGDDVFISYSRRDGVRYAEQLAYKLSDRFGYSCRLDLWETAPGRRLPKKLLRALHRSRMLVVVSSECAMGSPYVGKEIEFFKRAHRGARNIVTVSFGRTVEGADWFKTIDGLPPGPVETPDALTEGKPTDAALRRIAEPVRFTRRNRRLFWASAISLAFVLLLAGLGGVAAAYATVQGVKAAEATRNAVTQQEAARRSAEEAKQQSEAASAAKRVAEEQQRIADEQRRIADEQGAEAAKQTQLKEAAEKLRAEAERLTEEARRLEAQARANAKEQERIATSRRLAGQAERDSSWDAQRETEYILDRSFLLSAAAYKVQPTFEARRSLQRLFSEHDTLAFLLRGHDSFVSRVAATPDGETIVTSGLDNRVIIWDVESRKPRAVERLWPGPVYFVLTPDGKRMVVGGTKLTLWDVKTGTRLGPVEEAAPVGTTSGGTFWLMATHPDNKTLVTDGMKGELIFWNIGGVDIPQELYRFSYDEDGVDVDDVTCMAFSPDGNTLLTGSRSGTLRLWDLKDGRPQPHPKELKAHNNIVSRVLFSGDGRWFASFVAEVKDGITIWDARTLAHVAVPVAPTWSNKLAFSADGEWLAVGDNKGAVTAYPLGDLWKPGYQGRLEGRRVGSYNRGVQSLAFGGGSRYVIAGSVDGTIAVWNFDESSELQREFPWGRYVKSTAFSPDGGTLAVGDNKGAVAVIEPDADAPTPLRSPHTAEVYGITFHPTRRMFASYGGDGRLVLWTYSDGEGWQPEKMPVTRALPEDTSPSVFEGRTVSTEYVTSFAHFADRGETLLSYAPSTGLVFWDVNSRNVRRKVATPKAANGEPLSIKGAAATPDGATLAAGFSDGVVRLLDTRGGNSSWQTIGEHGNGVSYLALSDDGRWLASMDSFGFGILWRTGARPEKCSTFFPIPDDPFSDSANAGIGSIAFGRNPERNELILAIGTDRGVILWDAVLREIVGTFGKGYHMKLSFSPDGNIVAAGGDGVVLLYDVNPASWADAAGRIAGRALSEQEQQLFLGGGDKATCVTTAGGSDAPRSRRAGASASR